MLSRGWLPLPMPGRRLVGGSVDVITSLALSVELWSRRFAPQPVRCQQVIGERMPERHSRGLDQATHRNEAEAVVFEVGVDPLDSLRRAYTSVPACVAIRLRHSLTLSGSRARSLARLTSVSGLTP